MLTPSQLSTIRSQVRDGLTTHATRLHDARDQLHVYHGEYRDPEDNLYAGYDGRTDRDIPLMMKVVDALTGSTYKSTPARVLSDPQATEWLEQQYGDNRMTPFLRDSDRYAHAADIFAFQVHATGDLRNPIKIYGWTADSLVVWTDQDDPTEVVAVCTMDEIHDDVNKCRHRYRLWTTESVSTYLSPQNTALRSESQADLVSEEPHPYGIIPFSFIHYRLPTTKFHMPGIGKQLAQAQKHINFRLRRLADDIRYNRPKCFVEGLDPRWKPPIEPRPGEWLALPVQVMDSAQQAIAPKVSYVGPDLDFVTKEWDDLRSYWSWLLQCVGVPPATLPLDKILATPSGVAIVAQQIPLLLYAVQRQEMFRFFEEDLARTVCIVGYSTYRHTFLARALNNWMFTIHFPDVSPDLPPQDPDNYDYDLWQKGAISKVQWVQRILKLSREEAIEHLRQVAADEAEVTQLTPQSTPEGEDEVEESIAGDEDEQDEEENQEEKVNV